MPQKHTMQRANETVRLRCSAAGAVKGILWGVILAASVVSGAPDPDVARDAALLQPLWHTGAAAPSASSTPMPQTEVPLHHFDMPCNTCHEPAGQSDKSRSVGDINRGCTSAACHDNDPMLNHPVGVTAPAGVRGQMYPRGSGRITCITCHVPAGESSAMTDSNRPSGVLMRPDSDLCASCHLRMNSAGSRRGHWRFSTKAHLGEINPLGGGQDAIEIPFGRIDDESMACLNCHDDVTVTIPGENETRQEQVARWAGMQDHPIGMDYRALAGGQTAFFNYPVPASDHVRLFDDRVGCGSCHSLYARRSNFTVADRGELCRKCHVR